MKQFKSEHYIFNYEKGTAAERDISLIAMTQEACFKYICGVLRVSPAFKLNYFLCDSPETVGRVYGDNEACNAFARTPDKIYAVYNDKIKCIGFHEDAHLISYLIYKNESPAVREGLAMFFDRKWWGVHNMEWTQYYLKTDKFPPINKLLDADYFFNFDCSVTYPVMGSFTEWLITSYGIEKYLLFYKSKCKACDAFYSVFNKTPEELNESFVNYMRLFSIDPAVEKRIEELLNG